MADVLIKALNIVIQVLVCLILVTLTIKIWSMPDKGKTDCDSEDFSSAHAGAEKQEQIQTEKYITVRRKAAMADSGLNDSKELKNHIWSLPLSQSGVFGVGLEHKLKERQGINKHISDLLPDFDKRNKRKMPGASDQHWKRPPFSDVERPQPLYRKAQTKRENEQQNNALHDMKTVVDELQATVKSQQSTIVKLQDTVSEQVDRIEELEIDISRRQPPEIKVAFSAVKSATQSGIDSNENILFEKVIINQDD
ncbi:hypothetical protein MAR_036902 [Mya arenaria]|uniref:C1q domain-containing protein n=1 Tax=Mya arenaria TaxID=6604 RepID=A0ABY7FLY4_MYAAR|nr:hypothetical protein MAR_036902 [Mya arenaria]